MLFSFLIASLVGVLFTIVGQADAQVHDTIYVSNEMGNLIPVILPPPDTSYAPNKIILKFKRGALNTSLLCYTCSSGYKAGKGGESPQTFSDCRSTAMAQHFDIDSGIITSSSFVSSLHSFGGKYLTRITAASPCTDTFSISRLGDTLRADDYDWMLLTLDNDTSVAVASYTLTSFFQSQIDIAQPDFYFSPARTPGDPYYSPNQLSLHNGSAGINMTVAWDYQVGDYSIKVGIIDEGIDYRQCDLGGASYTQTFPATGNKVGNGWNFTDNNDQFYHHSTHGTEVAGIIGALTNNVGCSADAPSGVAGIGGGWGGYGGATSEGVGLDLVGCKVSLTDGDEAPLDESRIIAGILESSADLGTLTTSGYGFGVDVLNNSYGNLTYDEALRSAVNEAFENSVSFVAARGNDGPTPGTPTPGTDILGYPACYDPDWVVCVGAWNHSGVLEGYSDYGYNMDLLAPGGNVPGGYDYTTLDNIVYSTAYGGETNPPPNVYGTFGGTSSAAPHVSGTIGLLMSQVKLLEATNPTSGSWSYVEPEDYQGMIKASAVVSSSSAAWNATNGWGDLNAGTLFQMVDQSPAAYSTIPISNYTLMKVVNNSGGGSVGTFTKIPEIVFHNGGKKETNRPTDGVGSTYFTMAPVTFTYTINPSDWDLTQPLFAWGTSGANQPSNGWEPANTHTYANVVYEAGYSGISGGVLGGDLNNTGIIVDPSNLTLTITTYVYLQDGVTYYPDKKANIGYSISLFGRRSAAMQVSQSKIAKDGLELTMFPMPANNFTTVSYQLPVAATTSIHVYDVLGKRVLESSSTRMKIGMQSDRLDVSSLSAGSYYCRVSAGGMTASRTFMIVR